MINSQNISLERASFRIYNERFVLIKLEISF